MVFCSRVVLAVAAAVSTAALSYEYACYPDGERAIGAPGYPAVEYLPCCSGKHPLPMDDKAYGYDAEKSWGLFCGGTGKITVTEKCYKDGERAIGAQNKPEVPYMPCCSGLEPVSVDYDWGKFCVGKKYPEPKEDSEYIRCAGAEGYPYVEYVDCGYGYKCVPEAKYGWGSFCVPTTKYDCYGAGERAIGATGYPAIPYLPCCGGKQPVKKGYEWGLFCPDEYVKSAETSPKYPTDAETSPKYPTDAETSPKYPTYTKSYPKCVTKGEVCDPYGLECCDGLECSSHDYKYTCMMKSTKAPTTTVVDPMETDEE